MRVFKTGNCWPYTPGMISNVEGLFGRGNGPESVKVSADVGPMGMPEVPTERGGLQRGQPSRKMQEYQNRSGLAGT